MTQDSTILTIEQMEKYLIKLYGPMLGGATLFKALGYPSASALRSAIYRGQLSVPIFEIPPRRGRFALTADVAAWLVKCRSGAQLKNM